MQVSQKPEPEIKRARIMLNINNSKEKHNHSQSIGSRRNYGSIYERQKEWADKIQKKREEELTKRKNIKDENCTFAPKINNYSQK